MSTRLGRNPFDKKKAAGTTPAATMAASPAADEEIIGELIDIDGPPSGLIQKILIDLPNEALAFGSKARQMARALLAR